MGFSERGRLRVNNVFRASPSKISWTWMGSQEGLLIWSCSRSSKIIRRNQHVSTQVEIVGKEANSPFSCTKNLKVPKSKEGRGWRAGELPGTAYTVAEYQLDIRRVPTRQGSRLWFCVNSLVSNRTSLHLRICPEWCTCQDPLAHRLQGPRKCCWQSPKWSCKGLWWFSAHGHVLGLAIRRTDLSI